MLMPVLHNTPFWVFILFFGLLALGLRQTQTRVMKPVRVLGPALGLSVFSLYGVLSTWPTHPLTLACWLGAALAVGLALAHLPPPHGAQFDPDQRRFTVPGSLVPLAAMLGLFMAKYVLGAAQALHADWVQQPTLALLCATGLGAFSGIFAGRAGRLWRLAVQTERAARQWALSTPTA